VANNFYTMSQAEVIDSGRVARKAVAQLGLANSPAAKQKWLDATNGQGNYETWLTELVRKTLKVTATTQSNIVTVAYTSEDPNFAAAAANAFAQPT
jgi:uncharacterized protein involved in exopolysaccharide biosynthesis